MAVRDRRTIRTLCAVGATAGLAGAVAHRAAGARFFWNTRGTVHSPAHLVLETVVLTACVLLIVDAVTAIRQSGDAALPGNWRRYVRIGAGFAIVAAHATVLILGGHRG